MHYSDWHIPILENKITLAEASLFEQITKHLYPDNYKFKDRDINIFRAALNLAEKSNCETLNQVDYGRFLKTRLDKIRNKLGINTEKILEYYKIEKTLYPASKASSRLLTKNISHTFSAT